MQRSHTNRASRDDQGVVTLEFVLIFPFLVVLIFAIASFGLYFKQKIDVTSAARDAARTLALGLEPEYPTGMVATNVRTCPPGNNTLNASVTLTSTFDFSIPLVSDIDGKIAAIGTMRCGG